VTTTREPVVFLDGRLVPLADARISPEDRGFLFADGVYESIRYYPKPGSRGAGDLFELDRHVQRLRASLGAIRLHSVDLQPLLDSLPTLLESNELVEGQASIYVQVTRGVAPRSHAFPENIRPTVYARARRFELLTDAWRDGVATVTVDDVRWGRCDVKSIALLANVLAKDEAKSRGAFEALFVRDGRVTEGSHTAVAFVVDGVLRTHPSGTHILPSVTREIVLGLAEELGIATEERAMERSAIEKVDEVFLMGTTTEVMPVTSIDGRPVGSGTVGPVTRRLQDAYFALHP